MNLKKGEKKLFVKLKLIPDISFDSKESENDYINKKEQFKIKAKRDSLFDFTGLKRKKLKILLIKFSSIR